MSENSVIKVDIKIDPRKSRTRQLLQQAMNELLQEKVFEEINVQDIAGRANFNRATFYKHYLDKYDLLDATIRQRLQTMLDQRLPQHSTLTPANVNILIHAVYDCLSGFRGNCHLNHARNEQSLVIQQVHGQIYEVLLNWLQNSNARSGPEGNSPEIIALITSWMIFGPFTQVVGDTYKLPKQDVIRQVAVSVDSALKNYFVGG